MELGISSLGDLRHTASEQTPAHIRARYQYIIELAKLADQGGLDIFTLGEHHRSDYVIPAPEVALAAIASVTENIRLASGVIVLSGHDPVRVFEQFSTLDHVSGGRAEIIVGRGAFVESFPLFGLNINEYDEIFDEKLRLLLQLRDQESVTWRGKYRPPLDHAQIHPRPVQEHLPVWVGVGGTPSSVVRAGLLGLPITMGFFAGPAQFVSRVELYHRAAEQGGLDPSTLHLGAGGHMFVGKTSQGAREQFYPYYSSYLDQPGSPFGGRGMPREMYDAWLANSLPVGSPQQVIDDIMVRVELLGIDRFLAHIDMGYLPWDMVAGSVELFATEVAPVIRRETALAVKR